MLEATLPGAAAEARARPRKLMVLETHPIQYRAPIFQAYERAWPGELVVVYASDFSVRGYKDAGFGTSVAWDVPLLAGYRHVVLDNLHDVKLETASSLGAAGVARLIREERPDAILMHSLQYHYNWVAYLCALRYRIPVWIRVETQDEAVERGALKSMLRAVVYRVLYAGVSRGFYIGKLNRRHLQRHGLGSARLQPAHYCTPDPIAKLEADQKGTLRAEVRRELGISDDAWVIGFFGKLIEKKDPTLLLRSLLMRDTPPTRPTVCLFVGSGELEPALRELAAQLEARHNVRTVFAGFVNQSRLSGYYLASDAVVLPSRRMGETWGLVVNEALQAGCAVVVSKGVGSHADMGDWPRVRVIDIGDARALGDALTELSALERDVDWARERLAEYSVERSAQAFHAALAAL